MSQFYYTFYTGRTDVSSPEEFVGSMLISTMSNYYCRIFSEFNDNSDPIGREQYEIARSTLSSFDCCTVLENRHPFAELYKLLDWESVELKANQTRLSFTSVIKSLAKGRFGLLMRRVTHPRKEPNEEFQEVFREENRWDYRLYETVRETS
jgi:hypothetical protein